jgi:hypothetical protein
MALEYIEIKDASGVAKKIAVDTIADSSLQVMKLATGVDGAVGDVVSSSNPLPVVNVTNATSVTLTIASGASVSGSLDTANTDLIGFLSPAAWTTAGLTLEVSIDNSSWLATVFDSFGIAINYYSSLTASAAYNVDFANLLPFRYVRFRSGTGAAPVNQAAARTFTALVRPLA